MFIWQAALKGIARFYGPDYRVSIPTENEGALNILVQLDSRNKIMNTLRNIASLQYSLPLKANIFLQLVVQQMLRCKFGLFVARTTTNAPNRFSCRRK